LVERHRRRCLAQPSLIVRPALIARPAQPGVELILDRTLDDQPRPEFREFRERLARVLTDPHTDLVAAMKATDGLSLSCSARLVHVAGSLCLPIAST